MIMRITTQMLNDSYKSAGITTGTPTLLDYIDKDKTSTLSDLFSMVSSYSGTSTTQNSLYEQLEKAADKLEEAAYDFASDDEDNIFSQAREKDSTEEIKEKLEELISNYNDVIKKLGTTSSTLNTYYRKMLKEAGSENEEALSSIGISADKNGYLSLSESGFASADIDTLEKVLGKSSTFSTKAGFIAEHVSDNAESYLESSSSQYTATGQNYSSYLSSKYDLKG
jgi:archaellum component FlaC